MPTGIIINCLCVVFGGIVGNFAGHKLSESFKSQLNSIFGVCAMTIGVSSIMLMANMPAVIFSVIAGSAVGLAIHLGDWMIKFGELMEKIIVKIVPQAAGGDDPERKNLLVTTIVLFCCSGTGIYGSIISGMTGEQSILLAKSILDFPTAIIFACSLGIVTAIIAVPQFVIFMILFFMAQIIFPLCTPEMINDFKACGGVLLLATGFRICKIKNFSIADMIPAMIMVMPISHIWMTYILPMVQ